MYIRTLRKELHKLKKEENKWKEVKVIQLKIEGERKKKKYKEDWKGKKKLSRVAGPKSTWMASQLPPKILTLLVKKTSHRSLF